MSSRLKVILKKNLETYTKLPEVNHTYNNNVKFKRCKNIEIIITYNVY